MERWFSSGIKRWYGQFKRDLPWRSEKDPYKIWLSEIILQQTQVAQGQSYYLRFTSNYPTVKHLAEAKEDKVLKDWQGLGYYSRARNLHATAKLIAAERKGIFPDKFEEIRKLKGVGDYTAAAIASFAYNLPHAVVDGNVYRVLSRVFGIETPIDTTSGKKQFMQLAAQLLDKNDAATHNQAIMEFGSQFCKPVNPDCGQCIFKTKCFAFQNSRVNVLPVKIKKIKIKNRFLNYFVLVDKNKSVFLNRRSESDIWQGLYEFRLIETESSLDEKNVLKLKEVKSLIGKNSELLHISNLYKHILSHQHLHAKFFVVKLDSVFDKKSTSCNVKSLTKYAFPRLIEKFLNDCKLDEIV